MAQNSKPIVLGNSNEGMKTLRTKSEKVVMFDDDLAELVGTMFTSMHSAKGIGLSAVQIGELRRVIVAQHSTNPKIDKFVLVNPEITWSSRKIVSDEEGCLSFPELFGMVMRPEKIEYRGQTVEGKPITGKAGGLLARVIQHEVDHLNGVLFMDRVDGDLYTYEKQKDTEEY